MKKLLEVSGLKVSVKNGKEILHQVDFAVSKGETVVILGPNGAGKSTIAAGIMGNPKFVTSGKINFNGKSLADLEPDERARLGIYLSFQTPAEIAGISTTEIIRNALISQQNKTISLDKTREKITDEAKKIGQNIWFAEREANVGFSGGERKKNEILQLLCLKPKLAILDEIDSGLDVDAADNISQVLANFQQETGVAYLIISHNMRVFSHLQPDRVVVMRDGSVYTTGGKELVEKVEKGGFKAIFGDKK